MNNIKSLGVKAVLTTVTASDNPSSLSTRKAYLKAAGEDLARCTNIVFGVPESQLIVHDKSKIDEILSYAVGRNVPVVDAFRLGKLKHSAEQPT